MILIRLTAATVLNGAKAGGESSASPMERDFPSREKLEAGAAAGMELTGSAQFAMG
jgi:hypothetical protein